VRRSRGGHQRLMEEDLLAFGHTHLVPEPFLFQVASTPLEAGGPGEMLMHIHRGEYMSDVYVRVEEQRGSRKAYGFRNPPKARWRPGAEERI